MSVCNWLHWYGMFNSALVSFFISTKSFSSWDSFMIALIRRFGEKACGVFERLK
jgi:hypothetical protein